MMKTYYIPNISMKHGQAVDCWDYFLSVVSLAFKNKSRSAFELLLLGKNFNEGPAGRCIRQPVLIPTVRVELLVFLTN
jgi:hypothetical protein